MIWLLIALAAADLNTIKSEQNPGRRAELALENANVALDLAKDAYAAGHAEKVQAKLDEIAESVDIAYQSLSDAARNSRRAPKSFKKAEQKTHELLRRLDTFRQDVDFEEKAKVEKVRDQVASVNDNLLNGIMSKK